MVEVRNTGVSARPHSAAARNPVHSPAPFSTAPPAGTGLRNRLPPRSITVTPVRATPLPCGGGASSLHTVAWPTPTPGTSMIEFVGPAGRVPILMPRSVARVTAASFLIGLCRDDRERRWAAGDLARRLPAARAGRRGLARRLGGRDRGSRARNGAARRADVGGRRGDRRRAARARRAPGRARR